MFMIAAQFLTCYQVTSKIKSDNITRHMNRTFKQQFTEQQNLEVGVANNWGYSILSNNVDTKGKRQVVSQAPKVANITLRQFNKDIPKTDRIKQVEDEIKALHNERKLMEENERAAQAAINGLAPQSNQNKIMEWVDQKIREYNSIIEHRHLLKNNNVQNKTISDENKPENVVSDKQPADSMESRIADWAERKFAEFMNPKDSTSNKKPPPQIKKNLDKLSLPQDILKKIQQKKNELLSAPSADLTHQISINREIASLYRLFYRKNQGSGGQDFRKTRSIAAEPPRSLDKHLSDMHIEDGNSTNKRLRFISTHMNNSASDYNLMGDVKRERKNSSREMSNEFKTNQVINKYKESQYKKYYTTNRKLSKDGFKEEIAKGKNEKEGAKSTIQKEINEPYIQKKEVQTYRSLQNKIRSNEEALELWKSKIQDACNNSRVFKRLEESSKIKQIQQVRATNQLLQREEELEAIIGNNLQPIGAEEGSYANTFMKEIAEKNKKHEQQKEDIFAELLRKRHNKFNKLWGTKILVKYDSRGQAKQMLKGDGEKKPQDKAEGERGCKTSRSANTPKVMRMTEKGAPSVEASMIKEQNDDEHYWRMCKNEKINLLLKRR